MTLPGSVQDHSSGLAGFRTRGYIERIGRTQNGVGHFWWHNVVYIYIGRHGRTCVPDDDVSFGDGMGSARRTESLIESPNSYGGIGSCPNGCPRDGIVDACFAAIGGLVHFDNVCPRSFLLCHQDDR